VNNEQSREHMGDKMSVLDLLARTERGMYVNIEIQLANEHDMERRSLYYWSRVYTGQMSQGMSYQELKRTITINILNFRYMRQTRSLIAT
jgi:predicted transposase/invertase (TIGR01784 family)